MLFALVEYEYARVSMLGLVFEGEYVRVTFEGEDVRETFLGEYAG